MHEHDSMKWFRFVIFERIDDYLRLGWVISVADLHAPHGNYAMLMMWPCQCKLVEPL